LGTNTDSSNIGSSKSSGFYVSTNSSGFFRRPKLRIEHDPNDLATFGPEHGYPDLPGGYSQKYLRIRIRNKGHSTAHNCQAQLRVVIPKGANPQLHPSKDAKELTWGRSPDKSDISKQIDIHPVIGEALLHVVFSDSRFRFIPTDPNIPTRFASISIF
jgi:hypothetical protein